MAPPHVHSFYRVWFTWVDPTVVFFTILGTLWDPVMMVESFIPPSVARLDPKLSIIMHQNAAQYGFLFLIQAGLLRVTSDVVVWNFVQLAVFIIDIAILISTYVALDTQGRLNPALYTSGDWGAIGITSFVAVIRVFYLLGVGNGRQTTVTTASKKRA